MSATPDAELAELEPRAQVLALLGTVPDPEIPVLSVLDLGVIRFIEASATKVRVGLTPTYSGCPATRVISEAIASTLHAAGFAAVEIVPVLSPPWSSEDLSAAGRAKLEAYGIAPPGTHAAGGSGVPRRCPQCQGTDTECLSEFGSAPCKALYRCRSCREPFEYFKCL